MMDIVALLAIKKKDEQEKVIISNDLNDHMLTKDQCAFWKTWKSKFGTKSTTAISIDGSSDNHTIANKFAAYFRSVCRPNNVEQSLSLFKRFCTKYDSYMASDDVNVCQGLSVNVVDSCVRALKLGKASGIDDKM